jgi:hypothetical protein
MQVSKAHVSRVQAHVDTSPVLNIEYDDFQDIQLIQDRLNAATYMLGLNITICQSVKSASLDIDNAELFLEELRLQSSRVDHLLERAKSSSSLVGHACR